jgi:hypothetical protein
MASTELFVLTEIDCIKKSLLGEHVNKLKTAFCPPCFGLKLLKKDGILMPSSKFPSTPERKEWKKSRRNERLFWGLSYKNKFSLEED